MKWTRYGRNAILIQFAEKVSKKALATNLALCSELEANPPYGMAAFVPSFTTILVEFDGMAGVELKEASELLVKRLKSVRPASLGRDPIKEIPVIYDGPDLEELARLKNLKVDSVAALHSAPVYFVYVLGFAPGFPYLGELDKKLHAPRRESPRVRVAPGSVAIGGEHTGIYTTASPGGWNIIGRTPLKIFDSGRIRPGEDERGMFFLKPGDRVKFCPIKQ